jgi:hypothetical protein
VRVRANVSGNVCPPEQLRIAGLEPKLLQYVHRRSQLSLRALFVADAARELSGVSGTNGFLFAFWKYATLVP